MKNRLGITMRFNIKAQQELRALQEFYDFTDPKQVLQLAFEQLAMATNQLKKNLKEQQNAASKQTDDRPGGAGPVEPAASVSAAQPAGDSGTNAAAADQHADGGT